ncbi:MAG: hypothetical protein JWQ38_2545 [Flavipsychrobacter sp.]|nr:hypothetical protein [Flavipsychrobacter sp.]
MGEPGSNPVTYTALNVGRYNLPQIVFKGSDPNESNLKNILMGLKGSFKELLHIGKNPLEAMIKANDCQIVNLSKSYMRLQNPGLNKKGGGNRVKALYFYDQWKTLAGGNAPDAFYGKQYDYTIKDPQYGKISSGVASYEPMIGGDENPLRQPAPYVGQSGSDFPPNDPVDLYQEMPIGESLFPGAQVGYRLVTVSSVHATEGRSAQGIDKYEFYTAKDFPARVIAASLVSQNKNHYDFFSQSNIVSATQGYTLIFNDMHGKPKKVEHDVYNPASQTLQPISYQVFNYRQKNGELNNEVPCLVYDGNHMVQRNKTLGIEEDITLDSREKNEVTHTSTLNGNFNFFIIPLVIPIPVGIPFAFTWHSEGQNEFRSAVVAKVVQQYGILDNVVSYSEGAVTTLQNELYDPVTGQAIVTSINNEYKDREYTTNIPASWVYKGMGPSYNNIGYTDTGNIVVGSNHVGTLNVPNNIPLVAGDELCVSYTDGANVKRNSIVRVLGIIPQGYLIDTSYVLSSPVAGMNCFHGASVTIVGPPTIPYTHSDSAMIFLSKISSGSLVFSDTCVLSSLSTFNVNVTIPPASVLSIYFPTGATSYSTESTSNITATVAADTNGSFKISGDWFNHPGGHGALDVLFEAHIYPVYDTVYIYRLIPDGTCVGVSVLPRFPLNTPGWDTGTTLTHVNFNVINSGQTNRLNENVESYTSMDYPVNTGTGVLNSYLTNLLHLKANTFADSNTMINRNFLANADTVNPFTIGERGLWRMHKEYNYQTSRTYAGTTNRNAGLFNAPSMFAAPTDLPTTCFLSPYNYMAPYLPDNNWRLQRIVTKYAPNGKEIENVDAIGNYSTAVFGYNQELPVAVASNAKQGEILTDGFEDYNLLLPSGNIMDHKYSPFNIFSPTALAYTAPLYQHYNVNPSADLNIVANVAHTGINSVSVPSVGGSPTFSVDIPVNRNDYTGLTNGYNIYFPNSITYPYAYSTANEYMPFKLNQLETYILSYWVKKIIAAPNTTDYTIDTTCGVLLNGSRRKKMIKKTNIIDGWQQVEVTFRLDMADTTTQLLLPSEYYVDDVRIFPAGGNMKSFVYHPFTEKLMATLDENNFATLYEYDQEGNLVRVKKETAKGIMTVSESRGGNPKTIFP